MHHYRTRYQDKSITRLPNEVLLTHILHDRDLSADDIMDFGRTSHRFKELSKPVWRVSDDAKENMRITLKNRTPDDELMDADTTPIFGGVVAASINSSSVSSYTAESSD